VVVGGCGRYWRKAMLDEGFRAVKRTRAPDLWPEIEGREPRPPRREIPWGRLGTAALALLVAGAGIGLASWAFRLDRGNKEAVDSPLTVESSPVPPLRGDPRITAEIPLPGDALAGAVAVGGDAVWVGMAADGGQGPASLLKVDLDTNEIVAEVPLQESPWRENLVATGEAVWLAQPGTIQRIDPVRNEVTATIEVPGFISAMAADAASVWAVSITDRSDEGLPNTGTLLRIDPTQDEVVAEIPLESRVTGYDDEVRLGHGSVWVVGQHLVGQDTEVGGHLIRVDPSTNRVAATIPVDGFHMVIADEGVWVTSPVDGRFDEYEERWHTVVVDPATNDVKKDMELDGRALAVVAPDSLWFIGYDRQTNVRVWSVDPQTLELTARSEAIGSLYTDAVLDPGTRTVWISALESVVRIDIR
jgi:hypothetical protein